MSGWDEKLWATLYATTPKEGKPITSRKIESPVLLAPALDPSSQNGSTN